jgi:hypothetical protein
LQLDTDSKLIALQGCLLKFETSRENHVLRDQLYLQDFRVCPPPTFTVFVVQPIVQKNLFERLTRCMLSPCITVYVTDVNDRVKVSILPVLWPFVLMVYPPFSVW